MTLSLSFDPLTPHPTLIALLQDTHHMQRTVHFESADSAKRYLEHLASQWHRLGYGPWLVSFGSSVIGFGGLTLDEETPGWGPELVYYLCPSATGRGFAKQIGRRTLEFARSLRSSHKLTQLSAFAHPENPASIKTLEHLGFTYQGFESSLHREYFTLRL